MTTVTSAPAGRSWGLDSLGMSLSTLCMLHCLATPLLPLVATCAAADCCGREDRVHSVLALVLPAIALFAFYRGFAVHGSHGPWRRGAAGVALLVAGALGGELAGHRGEVALTVSGSLLLAFAHLQNRRMLAGCALPCCGDEPGGAPR